MMIRLAEKRDMDAILAVYESARAFMRDNGNPGQWGDSHPPAGLLEGDIESGQLYVVTENGKICGVFAFIIGHEPTYGHIEGGAWKNDEPYGTVHRIASDGSVRGVFEQCLRFCSGLIGNIRIDTHADNKIMAHLIEKNGFEKCGTVYMEDGNPRTAYSIYCD